MSNIDYKNPSGNYYRHDSEVSRQLSEYPRRESDLSPPISDYEYSSFSHASNHLPPLSPQISSVPPHYGTASPSMSPVTATTPWPYDEVSNGIETYSEHAKYPEVVPPAKHRHSSIIPIPEYQLTPDHGEKEVYFAPKNNYQTKFEEIQPTPPHDFREDPIVAHQREKSRKYPFGLTKKWFIISLVALVLVIVAAGVGIGLGVGLGNSHKKSSSSADSNGKDPLFSMGGALNPAYYSKEGAFNGSGVALADVNFGLDNSLYVFYQKYTGEIEQLIYKPDGTWAFVTLVATDAKNSTPLSTVAYIVDSVATWHLFYVSKDNILKQRTQSNASDFQTNIWGDGPLTALNLSVHDADAVGMQACYWGNYYGSLTNYNKAAFGASNSTASTGMNIWYADTNSTFQQYDWTDGQSQWNHTQSWPNMNTHAGIGCQSWLSNTTSYIFMVDNTDTLNIYWKDIDTNKTSTPTHPINVYTKAPQINIPNIHPSSSLGYTDFMIYQTSDTIIHGVNITWAAENTAIAPARQRGSSSSSSSIGSNNSNSNPNSLDQWALQPQDTGLGGTHMAITGSQPISGGRQELVFYQAVGNDLRVGKRDAAGGDFAFVNVDLAQVT